jgi:hypothetical protein
VGVQCFDCNKTEEQGFGYTKGSDYMMGSDYTEEGDIDYIVAVGLSFD